MIKQYVGGVKSVILTSSGKGGVGKSTMSVLIAEFLQKRGHKVGIVDADIYGPSMPRILGLSERPEIDDKKFIPLKHRDFQVMSIGFVVDISQPIAWRGPMATKALYQLLSATKWEGLDYLVVDMPPGTGDIHLSILENYNIGGAYIVTTPQAISMVDVERSINLYKKFDIKIKGIIENMSCEAFPGNAGAILAAKYNTQLLAKIPLIPKLSYNMDHGLPLSDLVKDFL